jgi:hypothetical protein
MLAAASLRKLGRKAGGWAAIGVPVVFLVMGKPRFLAYAMGQP